MMDGKATSSMVSRISSQEEATSKRKELSSMATLSANYKLHSNTSSRSHSNHTYHNHSIDVSSHIPCQGKKSTSTSRYLNCSNASMASHNTLSSSMGNNRALVEVLVVVVEAVEPSGTQSTRRS